MRKINRLIVLASSILLINACVLHAQERHEPIPLSELFVLLQTKFEVQFNYAEDVIAGIVLSPPPENLTLQESLLYLQQNTNLSFTSLHDNLILVTSKQPLILCGFLKSMDDQASVSLASIQGQKNTTISDDQGFFRLEVFNEDEIITIRHIGFKTFSRTFKELASAGCEKVLLEPQFQNLTEVIVSNYITSGINKLSDGSFSMDFSNFGILPGLVGADVLQSVQAFPGIQSINETVSNINIRGGTHDQNLLLWDDIKMYQSGHFFGLISMYNPQITHKVFLTKNGTDVSHTDGVSGTIAMQTEGQVNSKIRGNIGVNFTDANGFVDVPIGKKSSLQVAARKSISDFFETPTYKAFFNRISQNTEVESNSANITNSDKSFDFYDTSFRWIYNISNKDYLKVNFINVRNELQFNENTIVDNEEKSRQSNVVQNSIAEGIQYKRIWNDKVQTSIEIYETDYKLKAINANIMDSQRFLQENKVSETSFKLKFDYKLNDAFSFLNGYHVVETEVTNLDDVDNPVFKKLVSEVVREHALFSQVGYKSKSKNTNLNLGIRGNFIGKFNKTIIEPRLSFSQRFLSHFTLEVLGEFKHQSTSQVINFQNDFLGIEKRRWQLSNNEDIPIIRSKQISTGLNFSRAGWLVSAEAYYKKVNGINSQSQGFLNQYEFVRADGSYKAVGLDVLIRKSFYKFNSWLSYSYMDNTYRFPDFEANSFLSNYNIDHSITIGTTYTTNHLKLAAGLNWHSGKPTTTPISGHEISDGAINYEKINRATLQDYMRLDISAVYKLKLGQKTDANVGLSIWNVLDKENIINNYYRIINETISETQQRSLGFTPNIVLRVFFN
ncbi:TonB-dependent receptor plug domain-containing protein [Flavobacteriaceae bacterium LMO-SS05]